MSDSFLNAGTVALIERASLRAFATRMQLAGGGEWVIFSRWSESAQARIGIAPQKVLVSFANRQRRINEGTSAVAESTDGTLEKLVPFDVEKGDMFKLGEEVATIEVVYPPARGSQKAAFTLTLGSST